MTTWQAGAAPTDPPGGVGFRNITKRCSEVRPEQLNLTDNGIIPFKERIAGIYFDPPIRFSDHASRSLGSS